VSASIFILFVVKYQGVIAHFHRASHLIPDLTLFIYHALSPYTRFSYPAYLLYNAIYFLRQLAIAAMLGVCPGSNFRWTRSAVRHHVSCPILFEEHLTGSELIPNRYIVEFDTAASLKASNMKRSGTVSHPLLPKGQD
jgi:hypothetical protein